MLPCRPAPARPPARPQSLASILRKPGVRKKPFLVRSVDDALTAARAMAGGALAPIFLTSSVTGAGLDLVRRRRSRRAPVLAAAGPQSWQPQGPSPGGLGAGGGAGGRAGGGGGAGGAAAAGEGARPSNSPGPHARDPAHLVAASAVLTRAWLLDYEAAPHRHSSQWPHPHAPVFAGAPLLRPAAPAHALV
jgi:hypothetical protein